MKKARCFISYCSFDAKPNYVEAIVKYLNRIAKCNGYYIDFLFDKDLRVGNDLNIFMKEIATVDSVIVICTPQYKKRCEDEEYKEYGVYKEFTLIKERIQKKQEAIISNEEIEDIDFCIFPLVLTVEEDRSGNSVPSILTYLVREKINKIQFENKKGKYDLSEQSKQFYKEIFLDCIVSTCVLHSKKSEYIDMDIQEKLQKLVYNQKAEYAPTLNKKLFVNTFFFEQIKNQESYILVGRKGSGKTTTKLYFHSHNKEKYKGVIELRINEINLQGIYNYLFHGPYDANINLRTDFAEIFTYEKVIEYIWVIYIYIYSMYVVSCEYKNNPDSLSQWQKKEFKGVAEFISNILSKVDVKYRWKNGKNISTTLYDYAMTNVYKFFDKIIANSRDDERFFLSDIQAQISYENLIAVVLGEELVDRFYSGLGNAKKGFCLHWMVLTWRQIFLENRHYQAT